MGCGASYEKEDENVSKQIREMKKQFNQTLNLLMLGAGSSGKSTVVKQFQIINKTFGKSSLEKHIPIIRSVTIDCIQCLLRQCKTFELTLSDENEAISAEVLKLGIDSVTGPNTPSIFKKISQLWADPAVKECWNRRNAYSYNECTEYCLQNSERFGSLTYMPSYDDCLRTRRRTTGVVETDIIVRDLRLRFVDVGGQRAERRKWIGLFSDVTCILYLIALDEYDMKLYEERDVNRMLESLQLFRDLMNLPQIMHIPVIIFFNKYDNLEAKIGVSPLNKMFKAYSGGDDPKKALEFIKSTYLTLLPESRTVYTHITTAIDQEIMNKVWTSVFSITTEKLARTETVM